MSEKYNGNGGFVAKIDPAALPDGRYVTDDGIPFDHSVTTLPDGRRLEINVPTVTPFETDSGGDIVGLNPSITTKQGRLAVTGVVLGPPQKPNNLPEWTSEFDERGVVVHSARK